METCPHCHTPGVRIVRSRRNTARIVVGVLLTPLWILGGLAGGERGPILPLERQCPACGHRFRRRSFVDDLAGRSARRG